MKTIYVYSRHVAAELTLLEQVKTENTGHLIEIELDDVAEPFRSCIRTTPALINITDDLQGSQLLGEGVDGKLVATATILKRMQEEDLVVHNQETNRLDKYIQKIVSDAVAAEKATEA